MKNDAKELEENIKTAQNKARNFYNNGIGLIGEIYKKIYTYIIICGIMLLLSKNIVTSVNKFLLEDGLLL